MNCISHQHTSLTCSLCDQKQREIAQILGEQDYLKDISLPLSQIMNNDVLKMPVANVCWMYQLLELIQIQKFLDHGGCCKYKINKNLMLKLVQLSYVSE